MIKAKFAIMPYSLCPKEDPFLDRECLIMPMYRGQLITVNRTLNGWETSISRQAINGTVFGQSLRDYIADRYGYDLSELSFILNHRSVPDIVAREHLIAAIQHDQPLDWNLYRMYVYYRAGNGSSATLPLVPQRTAVTQYDIDDYYAELAKQKEENNDITGMYVARKAVGTHQYRWHWRQFTYAIKVMINGFTTHQRTLMAETCAGKPLLLTVDAFDPIRNNLTSERVRVLIGQYCLVTYVDSREVPDQHYGDRVNRLITRLYNVRIVDNSDIDWPLALHGAVNVDAALAEGALLFHDL
jgi:hypothetical protein